MAKVRVVPSLSQEIRAWRAGFQHVAGVKGAGRVIAVNRDAHAPIFKVADYGIVGDIFEIVPALCETARRRNRDGA